MQKLPKTFAARKVEAQLTTDCSRDFARVARNRTIRQGVVILKP